MALFDRILVPTDFSDGSHLALHHATWLARTHGGKLAVVHVMETGHTLALHASHEDTAEAEMASFLEGADDDVIAARVLVKADTAPAGVLREAREQDASLIVTATHGRSGLRHLVVGSAAEKIVRMSTRPVLTLREQVPLDRRMTRFLVPLDFSDAGDAALATLKEVATDIEGAAVHLLHVVSPMPYPAAFASAAPVWADYAAEARKAATETLDRHAADMQAAGIDATAEVIMGTPAETIVEIAGAKDTDLIVMATHGLTGLEHALMGSVAERVVRSSRVPVLTVKPG